MQDVTYLLKLGELTLKGGNKGFFVRQLRDNIRRSLCAPQNGIDARIITRDGRFYIVCGEADCARVEETLPFIAGLAGWARSLVCEKTLEAIRRCCVECAGQFLEKEPQTKTFKIEARRADKSFQPDSYGIAREAGEAVAEAFPRLKVDVKKPDMKIEVEVREKVFVYASQSRGLRGLPVGTAGRGLLLLSGGIDSPVAGYMMAKRGMSLDAVYFHAYPYTSNEALDKVIKLANIVGRYTLALKLYTLQFTDVEMKMRDNASEEWLTVLLRIAMMEAAEKIAEKHKLKCLITGESLSQVASQTIDNIACTQSRVRIPVLRPLIGIDKQDTIETSRAIGAYPISILPYEDCCTLFSPPHPVLNGKVAEANALYDKLELSPLIDKAISEVRIDKCGIS